jgi:hypothetical protein
LLIFKKPTILETYTSHSPYPLNIFSTWYHQRLKIYPKNYEDVQTPAPFACSFFVIDSICL